MIKKLLLICLFLGSAQMLLAQRYLTKVFESVDKTYDIPYGFNYSYKGDSTYLYLDIYTPTGDTASNRPLVVLAHGGSFLQGNRKATDISTLGTRLAERGYVVVSYQYRLGVDILSGNTLEKEFQQAVIRGTQDGRAALRFFNKSIANGNPYRLDPNQIYTGGISAGGILGLQIAFLDIPAEYAQLTIDTNVIGGIEGNSGNPGYNWRVKGVISLCGAMGNVSFMSNNKNISICNMHGTNDATVPYKTEYFKFFGTNITLLQGSFSVDSAAKKMGMDTRLHTFWGADHVPFTGTTATQLLYMDTTADYVAAYLYRHVTGLIPSATDELNQKQIAYTAYPNPAEELLNIKFEQVGEKQIRLFSIDGRMVYELSSKESQLSIALDNFRKGTYLLEINEGENTSRQKIMIR